MFGQKKDSAPLRADIAQAAENRNVSRRMFGRTLRTMEAKLMDGERVIEMAAANHERRAGLLVRTDRRLWFTVDSAAGNASDSISLDRISSARWSRDMTKRKGIGTMDVSTAGRDTRFTLVPEEFASGVQLASS